MQIEYILLDTPVVTFLEAAKHLRVYEDTDDEGNVIISVPSEQSDIEGNIAAALDAVAQYTERPVIASEKLVLTCSEFKMMVQFAEWRKVAIESIKAIPFGETEPIDIQPTDYNFRATGINSYAIVFKDLFPVADVSDALVITVTCTVPAAVKQAALLAVGSFYTYREDRNIGSNSAFNSLLRPYRDFTGGNKTHHHYHG